MQDEQRDDQSAEPSEPQNTEEVTGSDPQPAPAEPAALVRRPTVYNLAVNLEALGLPPRIVIR